MADRQVTGNSTVGAQDGALKTTPKRARAGFRGIPVLYVLIAGTALIIIAFLIIWFVMYPPRGGNHATFLMQPQTGTELALGRQLVDTPA